METHHGDRHIAYIWQESAPVSHDHCAASILLRPPVNFQSFQQHGSVYAPSDFANDVLPLYPLEPVVHDDIIHRVVVALGQ